MAHHPLTVKQAGQRHIARTFGQADVVLQEDGHTDCRDECNQALRVTHRAVSHPFDTPAVGAGNDDCADESRSYQQPAGINAHHHQRGDDHK